MRVRWTAGVGVLLLAALVGAQGRPTFKDSRARISYALGVEAGQQFRDRAIDLDPDAFSRGLKDVLTGRAPQLTEEQVKGAIAELQADFKKREFEARSTRADATRKAADAFLAENAKKDGVVTLPSGLQYRVLKEGTGKSPAATDTVTVNYKGTKSDGSEFDSTHKHARPAKFQLDHVIKGWAEGLQLMKEGARYELVIPPDLAYGDRGRLANEVLIFDVELISVGGEPEKAPAAEPAQPKAGQ